MDTPDKKTQLSPSFLSKFEDSPVFEYINTLSPIKPFSLGHSTQSFHLLSYSSPQALQTPPTSYLREPKITREGHVTDVPKNSCSQNVSEDKIADTSVAVEPADMHTDKVDKVDSVVAVSATDESLMLVSEFPRSLKYERDTPENNVVNCDDQEPHCGSNVAGKEIIPVDVIQEQSKEADCSFKNDMGVQAIKIEQKKELCEREKFVCDASDVLNRHSPSKENYHDELVDKSADSGVLSFVAAVLQPPNDHISDSHNIITACPVVSENNNVEVPLNKQGEMETLNERSQLPAGNARAVLAEEAVPYLRTEVDDKSCAQQQQTTRRRCLVYEMSGSHYRKLLADSTGSSPIKSAVGSSISNDKCLMVNRPRSNKFSSALPGIGLHLNALAAAAKDKIIVNRQTLTCRRQLLSSPCTTPYDSLISDVKCLTTQMAPEVVERESDEQNDGVQVSGSFSEHSISAEGIALPQSSPKKKRRKSENIGDADSCKRCNCKKSKCLKLYCECFAAGLYCAEPCNCQDCFNKPVHEETVIETRRQIELRNPLAFVPKVIKSSSTPRSADELNKTPASARHKRGCNCKKSGCLKKYCECYQGGVGCSLSCRCEGCKNTFGRKEESILYQETKFLQRNASDVSLHDDVPRIDEENHDQATPEPSLNARQPVRHPFHYGGMATHFPTLPGGPSLQICTSERFDKPDQSAFVKDIKIEVPEDDAPEALEGDYLLPNCVKSASPNCKRISPPHCDFETSPGWKSCRKLILQSIPSLPTFTLKKESME